MSLKYNPLLPVGLDDVGSGGSVTTPISLANGGWGLSNARTQNTTNGSITALALPTAFIEFSNSIGASILGITAQTDGTEIVLYNSGAGLVLGHQNASASAANRIIIPNAQNMTVPTNTSVRLRYNGAVSRWVFASGHSLATTAVPGLLSASDKVLVDTISGKVTGSSGANGRVAVFNGSNSIAGDANFIYNTTLDQLTVGGTDSQATGYFKASTPQIISNLTTFTATLTPFSPLSAPSAYTAVQSTPHLNRESSLTPSSVPGSSGYTAGDTIDYRIYAYSGGTYSAVYREAQVVINSNSDDVQLSWPMDTTGSETVEGYVILRQVNFGGFADGVDAGMTSSYLDNSTGWATISLSPTFDDFIANGSTINFTAYSKDAIGPNVIFSTSGTSTVFTDDASGNAYSIAHNVTSGSTTARVLNTDNTTYADGFAITQYPSTPFVSGSTVTPDTYGHAADGTYWTRSFDAYNYSTPLGRYSVNPINSTTSDPGSGTYYVVFDFSGQTSLAKIVRDTSDSVESASSPIYSDGSNFSGDNTVTPTSFYPTAGLFETVTAGLIDKPSVIVRSTSANYGRVEFQDTSFARLSYIEEASAQLRVSAGTTGVSSIGTTDRVKWNSAGVTLYGGLTLPYVAKIANYTVTTQDYLINCTSGTFTVTLPTAANVTGQTYVIKNSGTGVITVGTTSSQTIDGVTTQVLGAQYDSITVVSNGSNWIII